MASASTITGAAGEHYVMSQLLRTGFIAALAPVGVPNCDIVVTDDIGDRLCALQVKTRLNKGADGGWHMSKKHERLTSPTLFYAFVSYEGDVADAPRCFVVPSEVVARVLKLNHQAWLGAPGHNGHVRRDHDMRRFLPNYDRVGSHIGYSEGWLNPYEQNWAQLSLVSDIEDEGMLAT